MYHTVDYIKNISSITDKSNWDRYGGTLHSTRTLRYSDCYHCGSLLVALCSKYNRRRSASKRESLLRQLTYPMVMCCSRLKERNCMCMMTNCMQMMTSCMDSYLATMEVPKESPATKPEPPVHVIAEETT